MKSTRLAALAACVSTVLGACSATHLIYVHQTTVGVDLSAATTEGNTAFSFGYDSQTYAIVPRCDSATGAMGGTAQQIGGGAVGNSVPKGPKHDAMSLVAFNQTYVEGVKRIVIKHALATGEPAVLVAKSAATLTVLMAQTMLDATAKQAQQRLDGGKQ
jgi:hypothetical protein